MKTYSTIKEMVEVVEDHLSIKISAEVEAKLAKLHGKVERMGYQLSTGGGDPRYEGAIGGLTLRRRELVGEAKIILEDEIERLTGEVPLLDEYSFFKRELQKAFKKEADKLREKAGRELKN